MMAMERLKDLEETLEVAKKVLAEYEGGPSKRKGVDKGTSHYNMCRSGIHIMILDMPGVAKTMETTASMSGMNMDVDIIMDMAVSMNLNESSITIEDVLKELPFNCNL